MSNHASLQQESAAFIAFFTTFTLSKPVNSVEDFADGAVLFDVLSVVDTQYFRAPSRPATQSADSWILRFNSLKRLYRLLTQYLVDVLRQPTTSLEVPDLQAIAKEHNAPETLRLCRLALAVAVQTAKNKDIIARIQGLKEVYQSALMRAIEEVMSSLLPVDSNSMTGEIMTDDDHFYQIQSERSRLSIEKDALEKAYQNLLEEHRTTQNGLDEATAEKLDARAQLKEMKQRVEDDRKDRADEYLKAEIDRLRTALQKSEDNLAVTENDLDKRTTSVNELTRRRKVGELQVKADEAVKLKDKVDEYRHAADKLAKTENVMGKYKKKLEESADLRRTVKALEEQNASLVDKNASLEEEYRKVAAFKPLMESYKTQVTDLETKGSSKQKDIDTLTFEVNQLKTKMKIIAEERTKDAEALELYQERVRELELSSSRSIPTKSTARISIARTMSEAMNQIIDGEPPATPILGQDGEDQDDDEGGLQGELDDAISGRTMTDLKLQIRQLMRDLEAAKSNQGEASRVLVLENLLDDANRMKARYEADYLSEHREKLVLQNELEEIRGGKSTGDSSEVVIAVRQRLNETVEQLEVLQKKHAELEVNSDRISRDLTIAKSDLNLVNKDQLDILASLRESVNEDKAGLESELNILQGQLRDLKDKNRMQLEQINSLLMEKVDLQSESIGHREKMLEREKTFGDLRAVISGKGLPDEAKAKLLAMHEDNVNLAETLKTTQQKLAKTRQFIQTQEKHYQEQQSKSALSSSASISKEVEEAFRLQIKELEKTLAKRKRETEDCHVRYRQEQQLMLSAIHELGNQRALELLGKQKHPHNQRPQPSSWLGQQRRQFAPTLASSLVATPKPTIVGDLHTYLLEKDARDAATRGEARQFRTSEQQKRLSRRPRECFMKDFTAVGRPLVLGAVLALAAVEKAEAADAAFTRENPQPIFDTWGEHTHEVKWLQKNIIYGASSKRRW
ncbi:hypothetical protein FRB97_000987 [Tulasnella sp. 331]|nr:hypothetical protein FRB97_000987 [Tulasnella sp. 331]